MGRMCKKLKKVAMIQNNSLFPSMREERSLKFYFVMKFEWSREAYAVCYAANKRNGLARF